MNKFYATGRRKESTARVWVTAGNGSITVNNVPIEKYFCREVLRMIIDQAFSESGTVQKFDVTATVSGGGLSGQAGAIRLGISRALCKENAAVRPALKRAGFLTRDSREVERKKFGRAGARKRFQYSKR